MVRLNTKANNSLPNLSVEDKLKIIDVFGLHQNAVLLPLSSSHNRSFLILAPHQKRLVLRIYGDSWKTRDYIMAELNVLEYLNKNSSLHVPRPIANAKQELLSVIHVNELNTNVYCALFSFIGGDFAARPTNANVLQLGRSLGKLDLLLKQADLDIDPQPSLARINWDQTNLIDWPLDKMHTYNAMSLFPNSLAPMFSIDEIGQKLKYYLGMAIDNLPQQLIHADLNFDNAKFGNRVGLLDFDDIGFGSRVFDLVPALCSPLILSAKRSFTSLFVKGYLESNQLEPIELKSLPLFAAIRLFGQLGWALTRPDISWTKSLLESGSLRLQHICALIEAYQKGDAVVAIEPFFYGLKPYSWQRHIADKSGI